MIDLTIMFCGGLHNTFYFGVEKQLDVIRRVLEVSRAKSNADYGSPAQEVSKGNHISNWDRYFGKNVAAFLFLRSCLRLD